MKYTNTFKIAAALILGLTFFLWFVFSIIGMMHGILRELYNIIMVSVMAILGFLAWKRPLVGGIFLSVYAIFMALYFLLFNDFLSTALVGIVLFSVPVVIAGVLFIEADWISKKRN